MRFAAALAVLLAFVLAGCGQPAPDTQALADEGELAGGAEGPYDLPPAATLQASPSSGRAPLKVVFALNARDGEGKVAAWSLDFGDGTPPKDGAELPQAVEHVYEGVGSWQVSFRVTDGRLASLAKVTIKASATQVEQGPPTSAESSPSPAPPSSSTTTSTPPQSNSTTSTTSTTSTSTTSTSTSSSASNSTTSTSSTSTTSSTSASNSTTSTSTTTTTSSSSSSTSPSPTPTSSSSTSTTSDPSESTTESQTTTSEPPASTQPPPDNGTAPP